MTRLGLVDNNSDTRGEIWMYKEQTKRWETKRSTKGAEKTLAEQTNDEQKKKSGFSNFA